MKFWWNNWNPKKLDPKYQQVDKIPTKGKFTTINKEPFNFSFQNSAKSKSVCESIIPLCLPMAGERRKKKKLFYFNCRNRNDLVKESERFHENWNIQISIWLDAQNFRNCKMQPCPRIFEKKKCQQFYTFRVKAPLPASLFFSYYFATESSRREREAFTFLFRTRNPGLLYFSHYYECKRAMKARETHTLYVTISRDLVRVLILSRQINRERNNCKGHRNSITVARKLRRHTPVGLLYFGE